MCIFLFNRTTLQVFVTYLTGALYVHPLWFYKHQHDNWARSKLFVACQRWWFQWRFAATLVNCAPSGEMHNYCTTHIIKENYENFLIHRCNYILLSQVYCVWQVVKTTTIIFNNPVFYSINSLIIPVRTSIPSFQKTPWGWHPTHKTCRSLILVINCTLLSVSVGWYTDCKNTHCTNNIKINF